MTLKLTSQCEKLTLAKKEFRIERMSMIACISSESRQNIFWVGKSILVCDSCV